MQTQSTEPMSSARRVPEAGSARSFAGLSPRTAATTLFLIAVVASWQISSGFVSPLQMPSPTAVLARFLEMWTQAGFLAYAGATIYHVIMSVALAFVLGVAIALLAYFFPVLDDAIYGRLAPFMNSFPGIGWAFLALIWFGINSNAVIFTSASAMLPLALINVGAGLRELNRDTIEMSVSFTRHAPRRVRLIILPMLFPYLFSALRLCFGVSWQIVLIAELFCGAPGLGTIINQARFQFWTDMIFAVVLLILLIVYVVDTFIFSRVQAYMGKVYDV